MGMHQMLGPSFGAGADYEIERSLRFNSGDSSYLNRTPSSASNRKTWTWSGWLKLSKPSTGYDRIFGSETGSNAITTIRITQLSGQEDRLEFHHNDGSTVSNVTTNAKLRDVGAWYHIVVAVDTTDATAANRTKIYLNGEEQTLSVSTYLPQNHDTYINSTSPQNIGRSQQYGAYLNGYLADVQFIDGTKLSASSFGEYNDDNNWVPKRYSGSYGSNGFHLKFADNSTSAALGTDSSGNNNTWTVNNLVAAAGVALPGARTGVFFDGTDDKISFTNNTDLDPGNGTFTLECFVYKLPGQQVVVYYGTGVGHAGFRVISNGKLGVERINTAFDLQTTGTVPENQWVHVAWVKSGTTIRGWINGVDAGSATTSQTYQGTFVTAKTLPSDGFNNTAISDLHLVKGTALYTSSFTPPTTISAHANTILLCFQNASSATTATVAPYGVTLTASSSPVPGAYPTSESYQIDSLLDSPINYEADSGNNGGNYCCWNPLSTRGPTFTDGNLTVENGGSGASGWRNVASTLAVSSGKWYAEFDTVGAQVGGLFLGVQKVPEDNSQFNPASFSNNFVGMTANSYSLNCFNGSKRTNSSDSGYGSGMSSGDKIMLALDLDNGKIWWGKNGTWFASGDPDSGTNAAFTGLTGTFVFALGISSNEKIHSNWGQRPFAYSNNISGFKSVCTMNFAEPPIADGSTAFNTRLWSGDANPSRALTGLNMAPDFVWIKKRSGTFSHYLFDIIRSNTKQLKSDSTDAEGTTSNKLISFDSDGFTVGNAGATNGAGDTYVGWAWDAGTSTVSNTDGSITSSVRASATNGFSIVSWTGTGATGSIGHGLNSKPQIVITKNRTDTAVWVVDVIGVLSSGTDYLLLGSTNGANSGGSTADNSVVNILQYNDRNGNGDAMIAYCFTSVAGYSSIGSYAGNGLADGPFVNTGFRPSWLLLKESSSNGELWTIYDSKRNTFNVAGKQLYPSLNAAEADATADTHARVDFLSNGFKIRGSHSSTNTSGATILYIAFAEHPFKTARAR